MCKEHKSFYCVGVLLGFLLVACASVFAQFTGSIQGNVEDSSNAAVSGAKITLTNPATGVTSSTTSDSSGNYRFVSLAPGAYKLTVEATGFSKSQIDINLLTEQNLSVPITLKVGSISEQITVTTEAPVVDTADSRTHLTLESRSVAQLPVAGRNLVTLVTLAPGVSGLGTSGSGSPGSGVDNYSTETQVDASANGQGQNNNMYVVDGLDVASGIRQGVLNLTPNPDAIQETSIQVNTFSSEYSRAGGLQTIFTTLSGTDTYHGSAADYFTYQKMFARQHFSGDYQPFHSNNMSFAIGGPIIPHHQAFFYFAVEPLRSSVGASGSRTFVAQEFIDWSNQHHPASLRTEVLANYRTVNMSGIGVAPNGTAEGVFGKDANGNLICATAAVENIPCDLPMIDSGNFGGVQVRNGTQYFVRLDKAFSKDRVYGSLFRTLLTTGVASPMAQFSALNHTWQYALQGVWTHTFSSRTLNDAMFGVSRVEGVLGSGAKDYTVPSISVNGVNTVDGNQAFGVGFAQGDFIQHNYHWRDVLTHVRGTHTLKFGYEGWYGDDVEPFQGPWSTPKFSFNNLLELASDNPVNENGIMYNPQTGTQQLWFWNAASRTFGLFAEDTWKATRNLTLTLGLRFDDSGNPWSKNAATVFGNFYRGGGSTEQEQVANGVAKPTHNALLSSPSHLFSPRVGFAWDPSGNGEWAVRGGFGMYNNWLTSANVQEEFRGNPPGLVTPNFVRGGTPTSQAPIFALGTGSKPPFGFVFPTFTGGLNAQGGQVGISDAIGGINPHLKSPEADVWSLSVERKLGEHLAASVGYSGSHSYNIVANGNSIGGVSYGVDINAFPGDLINQENNSPTALPNPSPIRLNPSFGPISYADNDRHGNYESIYFDLKGRFGRGFVDASYTRSSSKDDGLNYPNSELLNPQQYYGPSATDAPNRFSLSLNYSLKGLNNGAGAIGHLTGGWGVSGTSIYQSGSPFTVVTANSYQPICANA